MFDIRHVRITDTIVGLVSTEDGWGDVHATKWQNAHATGGDRTVSLDEDYSNQHATSSSSSKGKGKYQGWERRRAGKGRYHLCRQRNVKIETWFPFTGARNY